MACSNRHLRAFVAFTCIAAVPVARGADATATMIGNPVWQPAGFTLCSLPVGQDGDFHQYYDSIQSILPAPHHSFNPDTGYVTPGTAHTGDYAGEILAGVTASGFKRGPTFDVSDFAVNKGVSLAFMLVPVAGRVTGSSPDFASGPIVPNSVYPIHQSGLTTRNGAEFDPAWSFDLLNVNESVLPALTTNYDGWSHQPVFETEFLEFGPAGTPANGAYSTTLQFLDVGGNGWSVTWGYSVVPEPVLLAAAPGLSVLLLRRRS